MVLKPTKTNTAFATGISPAASLQLSVYPLSVLCWIPYSHQLHPDSLSTDVRQDQTSWFRPSILGFKTLRRFPFFPPKPQSFISPFLPADLFLPPSLDLSFSSTLYVSVTMPSSPGNTASCDLLPVTQIFLIPGPVFSSSSLCFYNAKK